MKIQVFECDEKKIEFVNELFEARHEDKAHTPRFVATGGQSVQPRFSTECCYQRGTIFKRLIVYNYLLISFSQLYKSSNFFPLAEVNDLCDLVGPECVDINANLEYLVSRVK